MSKLRWQLQQLSRQIWFPVTIYGLIGLCGALIARPIGPYLPEAAASLVEASAVDALLHILANSMLTVTTFSLSIMTAAYAFASSAATPRAFRLLQSDRTAQRVLATFLGAFIFSLVGIIALEAGFYNGRGRLVLLLLTIAVLVLIVTNLIRWIEQLTHFGQMDDTMTRVEVAAIESLEDRLKDPYLGGQRAEGSAPKDSVPIFAGKVGHVRHIDMAALSEALEDQSTTLTLAILPGTLVYPASPLAYLTDLPTGATDIAAIRTAVLKAIVIGPMRDFEQDPRHGLIVLAQIATRALSPGINDPGTAIAILQRLTRVLTVWPTLTPAASNLKYPAIYVPPLQIGDCVSDAYSAIGREGAGTVEVGSRIMESLLALTEIDPATFGVAAVGQADRLNTLAQMALALDVDKATIADLCTQVRTAADVQTTPQRSR